MHCIVCPRLTFNKHEKDKGIPISILKKLILSENNKNEKLKETDANDSFEMRTSSYQMTLRIIIDRNDY